MPQTELEQIKLAIRVSKNQSVYTKEQLDWAEAYLSYTEMKYGTTNVYAIERLIN